MEMFNPHLFPVKRIDASGHNAVPMLFSLTLKVVIRSAAVIKKEIRLKLARLPYYIYISNFIYVGNLYPL